MSQPADKHVATCDGFEYGTERGIGRRHREAECGECGDRRVGYSAPHTNCDYHEWVNVPRVWVTCTRDKASNRGAWIALEPRIALGVLTPESCTKVGVVSDGKIDGDNDAPVMVETVQVGAERTVSVVVIVVVRRGSAVTPTLVSLIIAVGRGEHRQRALPGSQVARDNRRVAADLRCGSIAVMAWSCRRRR